MKCLVVAILITLIARRAVQIRRAGIALAVYTLWLVSLAKAGGAFLRLEVPFSFHPVAEPRQRPACDPGVLDGAAAFSGNRFRDRDGVRCAANSFMLSAMDGTKSSLERAFELAASGMVPNVSALRARLDREGYSGKQVTGPSLTKQLRRFILRSHAAPRRDVL